MLIFPIKVPPVTVYAGNDVVFPEYMFLDGTGSGVDLSDWSWQAQWRPNRYSDRVIELSVDVSDSVNGKIVVSATDSDTVSMKTKGVWDLTGVLIDETKTLIYGETRYVNRVTRV